MIILGSRNEKREMTYLYFNLKNKWKIYFPISGKYKKLNSKYQC